MTLTLYSLKAWLPLYFGHKYLRCKMSQSGWFSQIRSPLIQTLIGSLQQAWYSDLQMYTHSHNGMPYKIADERSVADVLYASVYPARNAMNTRKLCPFNRWLLINHKLAVQYIQVRCYIWAVLKFKVDTFHKITIFWYLEI